MKPAILRLTPRALRDIDARVDFVARFPGGKPEERRHDIHAAFQEICEFPERHPIEVRRRRSGLKLRRHQVKQFTIVYAYLPPEHKRPWSIVTVRAVQHRRIKDVFFGVRENTLAEEEPTLYRTV
jgi:plasmid stabilization system protein ParE